MPACHMKPRDKKAFIDTIGKNLVSKHGKRKYYQPAQVRDSAMSLGYSIDIHCWAYCIFTSQTDFQALHDAAGEVCDYAAMKAEILTDLAGSDGFSFLDINLSWLEWPDINLSSIFSWFDTTP